MPYSKIQLEKRLFTEKRNFSEMLLNDIDAEITLLFDADVNLRQQIAEKNLSIRTLDEFIKSDDPSSYKKFKVKTASEFIKEAKELKIKDQDLIAKIEKLIGKIEALNTSNTSSFKVENKTTRGRKKKVTKSQKLNVDITPYAKIYLIQLCKQYIVILQNRINNINKDIETFMKDRQNCTKLSDKETIDLLNSLIAPNKKSIDSCNNSIFDNKEKIRALDALKTILETTTFASL